MAIRKSSEITEYKEALLYAVRICARQETYRHYIREKLQLRKVSDADIEKVLEYLEKEKFIDESRYAKAFVNDKAKLAKWGFDRIKRALLKKRIPLSIINEAGKDIELELQYKNAMELAKKKLKTITKDAPNTKQRKIFNLLAYRGYNSQLIWKIIADLKIQTSEE